MRCYSQFFYASSNYTLGWYIYASDFFMCSYFMRKSTKNLQNETENRQRPKSLIDVNGSVSSSLQQSVSKGCFILSDILRTAHIRWIDDFYNYLALYTIRIPEVYSIGLIALHTGRGGAAGSLLQGGWP
jgi:hypothetical protein